MRLSFDFTNKLLDFIFRGQSITFSNSLWIGLFTVAPTSSSSGGTEVSATDYTRQSIDRTLFDFCGTQGTGTTEISSGTSGTVSNNVEVTWPTPTSDWGTIVGFAIFNQETGTDIPYILYCDITNPVTVTLGGSAVSFAISSLQINLATRS